MSSCIRNITCISKEPSSRRSRSSLCSLERHTPPHTSILLFHSNKRHRRTTSSKALVLASSRLRADLRARADMVRRVICHPTCVACIARESFSVMVLAMVSLRHQILHVVRVVMVAFVALILMLVVCTPWVWCSVMARAVRVRPRRIPRVLQGQVVLWVVPRLTMAHQAMPHLMLDAISIVLVLTSVTLPPIRVA